MARNSNTSPTIDQLRARFPYLAEIERLIEVFERIL